MEPTGCPETLAANYQSTLHNIQEEQISQDRFFLENAMPVFGTQN
jgi:hypothetical protein